jgi:solute:Na+ symporter, SSS family
MNLSTLPDLLVVAAYLSVILYLGKKSSHAAASQEGFFLAGRKLGKVYQFFLNFGNATDANGAVSTASLVYQQGASGVWVAFQTIFMNPYYWFMNAWFRRVRLVTVAELFDDRLGSKGLGVLYAAFQVSYVIFFIGWGNLVGYNVTASLMPKPEQAWTADERHHVQEYRDYLALSAKSKTTALSPDDTVRLSTLSDLYTQKKISSSVSYIKPWMFYLIFTCVVGTYLMMGGMSGTAKNEVFQGILIVIFSLLLIPFGFARIGGVQTLRHNVPHELMQLIGSAGTDAVSWYGLLAILLVSIVQINAVMGNMGVSGSAKDEYAARFGAVSGTYAKRLMIMMWTFVGLIGLGIYVGDKKLADPDVVWGTLSRDLLIFPGCFGLMLAGLLAAMMSNIATQSMASSALFVRNVLPFFSKTPTEKQAVNAARITIMVVLLLGVLVALSMNDIVAFIRVQLTVNVPWGAAIIFIFFWRRLTKAAVWWCVSFYAIFLLITPFLLQFAPSVATNPALLVKTHPASVSAHSVPMFWDHIEHANLEDPNSPMEGTGRFNVEAWTLSHFGLHLSQASARDLQSVNFFVDGILPFILLVGISLITRPPDKEIVDQFFGKMKTPVGATPELEAKVMEDTRLNPNRFNHLKLFPSSNWEWTRWDRVDGIGFAICMCVTCGIVGLFWFLLRLTAGA